MTVDELLHAGAVQQARAVAAGSPSAGGLLQAQRAAIARVNPAINAYVEVFEPSHAGALQGGGASPLAGTTFAVKDNIDVAGSPTRSGLAALDAAPATRDAGAVARLRAAGLVCLGKLNMHPVALGATNHNPDFGDCCNPLRAGYTPGGSSGGSGAAVAAGLCGIALGTDTMGSVRIPAAYCGVAGFKPSFGAVPSDGMVALAPLLDHIGVLARRVEDLVQAFRIIGEPRYTQPAPPRDVRSLRLAVPADPAALQAAPEVMQAFTAGLDCLRATGFTLVPVDLSGGTGFTAVRRAGLLLSEAELRNTLDAIVRERPQALPDDLRGMMEFIGKKSAADLARAVGVTVAAGQWLERTVAPFDALLLPTAPQTAFPMDAPVPANQADYTAPANMAGAPALSLPLPVPAGELPVGLQLVGHRGADMALLDIALAVEEALGR